MKNLKKAAAVTMVAGGLSPPVPAWPPPPTARRAHGKAVGSPGVVSGNLVQAPVHIPVNVVGNSVNVIGVLNPAFGNLGSQPLSLTHGHTAPTLRGPVGSNPGGAPSRTAARPCGHRRHSGGPSTSNQGQCPLRAVEGRAAPRTAPRRHQRQRTATPRSRSSTNALYAATCARRAVRSTGRSAVRPRRHLRRAHRPAVPVLVRHARPAAPPAAPAPAPAPHAADTRAPAPPAPARPAPGTRRSPPPPPAPTPATSSRDSTSVASRSASASSRSASPRDGTSAGGASRTGQAVPDDLHMHVTVGPGLVHLRHQPQRPPVADDRLLRLQRPRVELRRPAQPQRMPRRGQRDPQPGHPERPQPPQRERQPDRPRLAGQPLHPVHRVLTDDGEHRVIRRDKSGKKGISPCGKAS